MENAAQYDSEKSSTVGPHKKRPDQQIYRPGMFRRGIDLTQTKPKAENQPPSEKRMQQMRKKEQFEREKNNSMGFIPKQKVCFKIEIIKND